MQYNWKFQTKYVLGNGWMCNTQKSYIIPWTRTHAEPSGPCGRQPVYWNQFITCYYWIELFHLVKLTVQFYDDDRSNVGTWVADYGRWNQLNGLTTPQRRRRRWCLTESDYDAIIIFSQNYQSLLLLQDIACPVYIGGRESGRKCSPEKWYLQHIVSLFNDPFQRDHVVLVDSLPRNR